MIKRCVICGAEFEAKRSTAKYCSNRCRLMAQRGQAFVGEVSAPDVRLSMTEEEVLSVIERAHEAASDLSRASMLTPSPLCLKLRRVSKKLEDSLESEGL